MKLVSTNDRITVKMENQCFTDPPTTDTKDGYVVIHKDREDLVTDLQNKQRLLVEIDKKNKELFNDNKRLKKEKDEALSRLSKIAGEKLTRGNPAITDLGNPNRPAKIGEQWGSLYTDEWMDAYEELGDKNKKAHHNEIPEKELLWDTDWCYRKCSTLAGDQVEQIKPFLHGVTTVLSLQDQSSNDTTNSKACVEDKELKQTMDSFIEHFLCQRRNNTRLVDTVINICKREFESTKPNAGPHEIKFVETCCELCWYMQIADPPMVIEYENFETKKINSDKFNKYDKSGTIVEYVVWPVLLLHRDGPILAKGTVQTFVETENVKCKK